MGSKNRLSVLSSFTWETSPNSTGPLVGSPQKRWYKPGGEGNTLPGANSQDDAGRHLPPASIKGKDHRSVVQLSFRSGVIDLD